MKNLFGQSILSISNNDVNVSCDICLQAKQTRDTFPTSLNNTDELFGLIHYDLWGP